MPSGSRWRMTSWYSPRGAVDRNSPERPHGQSFRKVERQPLGVALPDHGADRRRIVAEAEVQMPRLGPRQVRDLPAHGDLGELGLQGVLDSLGERRDRLEHRSVRIAARTRRNRSRHGTERSGR